MLSDQRENYLAIPEVFINKQWRLRYYSQGSAAYILNFDDLNHSNNTQVISKIRRQSFLNQSNHSFFDSELSFHVQLCNIYSDSSEMKSLEISR